MSAQQSALQHPHLIDQDEFKAIFSKSKAKFLVFDIETGPLPRTELEKFVDEKKIKYPDAPGVFDATKVKYGTRTKRESRVQWLDECRRKHIVKQKEYKIAHAQAYTRYLDSLEAEAPLFAHLNVVLAIGYGILVNDHEVKIFLDIDTEENLTRRFWFIVKQIKLSPYGNLFSFNGNAFDIPVLTQKGWKYRFNFPYLFDPKYRKTDSISVDLALIYRMASFRNTSLDHITKSLGISGKKAGVTGDMFWKLLQNEPTVAKDYLYHDIYSTYALAKTLGELDRPYEIITDQN